MSSTLILLEKKGLQALRTGDFDEAIDCFNHIIAMQPDFEHGMGYYHLACAHEDLGHLDLAKSHFERALQFAPSDIIRLGGYASFLYLHDHPLDAFNAYMKLLKLEQEQGMKEDMANSVLALKALGHKLGWSEEKVSQEIERCLFSLSVTFFNI